MRFSIKTGLRSELIELTLGYALPRRVSKAKKFFDRIPVTNHGNGIETRRLDISEGMLRVGGWRISVDQHIAMARRAGGLFAWGHALMQIRGSG
jgi:hypothetical protein